MIELLSMIKKSLNSLAGKLIITVGALMAVCTIILGYIFIRYEEKVLMSNLINHASSTTDLIRRAIHYGMLSANRETIEQTIESIGHSSLSEGISLFDKKGKVVYSSKKTEVGRSFEKDFLTCRICHKDNTKPTGADKGPDKWAITLDKSGAKTLKFVSPIYNETTCMTAPCHHHPKEQRVLGILETNFNTKTIDIIIKQNRIGTVLFVILFIILMSFSLCIILYRFVSKPVSLLDEGMRKIAKGELDHVIELNSNDEMGLLARTFNSMVGDIRKYRENMENWKNLLEEEVQKKTAEIMKAHDQLINAEKLASLGRMAAGVAHELNSPLTGIITFAHLMLKRTPSENKQDIEDLEVIIEQANRCSKIIKSLLGFSRKTTAEKMLVNINDLTESTISMVRNQAKFHNIKFNLNFDSAIPSVAVDPNQMQQVLLNLLINAADAMNERGQVTAATRLVTDRVNDKKYVEIELADTGPGIPEDQVGRIFEPFFTTKPVGKGTGLGLAVSYGIIKKHGGNIFVRSEAGKGASFFVRIPLENNSEIG